MGHYDYDSLYEENDKIKRKERQQRVATKYAELKPLLNYLRKKENAE